MNNQKKNKNEQPMFNNNQILNNKNDIIDGCEIKSKDLIVVKCHICIRKNMQDMHRLMYNW
jgi:hypothetical protein